MMGGWSWWIDELYVLAWIQVILDPHSEYFGSKSQCESIL